MDGWGRPYVLDRRTVTLQPGPYRRIDRVRSGPDRGWESWGEWARSPAGVWLPTAALASRQGPRPVTRRALLGLTAAALAGMAWPRVAEAGFSGDRDWPTRLMLAQAPEWGNPVQRSYALDSAYTFNSAGDAIGWRVVLGAAKTLAAVYLYVVSATGTAANVNDLNVEVRNDNGSHASPDRSGGATLHTSASKDPNGDSSFAGWHQWNPADVALSAGTTYWLIVADADGNGTDYATILYAADMSPFSWDAGLYGAPQVYPYSTTNGFASDASDTVRMTSMLVLEFDDGTVLGNARADWTTSANDANRKGLHFDGLTASLKLWGALLETEAGSPSSLELYAEATAPGGTTLASGSAALRTTSAAPAGFILSSPYALAAATAYRLVCPTAGSYRVRPFIYGAHANGHEAVLRKARAGGSGWYLSIANGTTNWSNDDPDRQVKMNLLFDDLVEAAPAGPPVHGTPGTVPSH